LQGTAIISAAAVSLGLAAIDSLAPVAPTAVAFAVAFFLAARFLPTIFDGKKV